MPSDQQQNVVQAEKKGMVENTLSKVTFMHAWKYGWRAPARQDTRGKKWAWCGAEKRGLEMHSKIMSLQIGRVLPRFPIISGTARLDSVAAG